MQETKNKNIYTILIIVLSILLAIAIGLFAWFKVMETNYNTAVKEFDAQNYSKAQESFRKASLYHNGSKLAGICGVFEELKNSRYEQAAAQAEDVPDYKIKDEDLQKKVDGIRSDYYDTAKTAVYTEDLQDAVYIFKALRDYNDSAQAADYYDATIHMNNDDLDEAIRLFEAADTYQDASTLASNCKDYKEAAALQEKGDEGSLEQADKIFTALGDFKDSEARGLECRSVKLFKDASTKAEAGDYDGAYKILNEYPNNPYPGWTGLLTESKNNIDYAKAEKEYSSEHYYKAYVIYDDLGDFKDSAKKKKKCVKDTPDKKILFQDDDFKSSSVSLTFKNTATLHNYIKMYNSKDKLVARIFVKKGDSATIHLTSGTYHINKAYGTTWYGKKDMFGDAGYYTKCKVNGSYDFSLLSNYIYTLSSGSGSGDAVSGESVGADGF